MCKVTELQIEQISLGTARRGGGDGGGGVVVGGKYYSPQEKELEISSRAAFYRVVNCNSQTNPSELVLSQLSITAEDSWQLAAAALFLSSRRNI